MHFDGVVNAPAAAAVAAIVQMDVFIPGVVVVVVTVVVIRVIFSIVPNDGKDANISCSARPIGMYDRRSFGGAERRSLQRQPRIHPHLY